MNTRINRGEIITLKKIEDAIEKYNSNMRRLSKLDCLKRSTKDGYATTDRGIWLFLDNPGSLHEEWYFDTMWDAMAAIEMLEKLHTEN